MDAEAIKNSKLEATMDEGDEYWVKMKDFKSDNMLASFFDFCPYIKKEGGKLVLKDTLCFKQKGYICARSD